jgi:hypothetical protein
MLESITKVFDEFVQAHIPPCWMTWLRPNANGSNIFEAGIYKNGRLLGIFPHHEAEGNILAIHPRIYLAQSMLRYQLPISIQVFFVKECHLGEHNVETDALMRS